MNTNEIYKAALKLPSEKELKEEATLSKEEMDWQIWRTYPQTIEFVTRLKSILKNSLKATEAFAINGDEKILRASAVEALTIRKILNLTQTGKYAND